MALLIEILTIGGSGCGGWVGGGALLVDKGATRGGPNLGVSPKTH